MPSADVTSSDCPRGGFHGQAPGGFPVRLVITAKAAEAICQSKTASSQMEATDPKLKQQLVVMVPKMEGEKLKSISS